MFAAIDAIFLHRDRIADPASSLVFHDHQPSLAESHPLHAFIQWPNRQAGRRRDFSSAHTSLQATVQVLAVCQVVHAAAHVKPFDSRLQQGNNPRWRNSMQRVLLV